VSRFRYLLDPLCLAAIAAYALNRWAIPAADKGPFLQGYFSDLLLIPAALPLMLWLQRRLRLRAGAGSPNGREILFHLLVWSAAAEWVGPHLFSRATGDLWDVLAYSAGALVAACWWGAL